MGKQIFGYPKISGHTNADKVFGVKKNNGVKHHQTS